MTKQEFVTVHPGFSFHGSEGTEGSVTDHSWGKDSGFWEDV